VSAPIDQAAADAVSQPAPDQVQPFDMGNILLGEAPAQLVTQIVNTPGGQRLALTVRTPSTTLTVFLAKDDANRWLSQLQTETGRMSGLILPR
jgi:hypothetical protein